MARHRQHRNGPGAAFTLVELIVVIAILAIAAVMVVPQAVGTSDLEAVSAARMVAADVEYAQNVAITSQQPVTVTFNPGGNSYALTNASGALIHPMSKSAYTVNFASQTGLANVDVVSAGFGEGTAVTFDELGAPDNAGTVVLQAGSHVYHVDVAAVTGKVTVTAPGT